MQFKGTLVITDPCYLVSYYGSCLMKRDTIYGDWSCMTYPGKMEENNKPIDWDDYYFNFFNEYNFSGLEKEEKEKKLETFKKFKNEWKDNILGEFCADSGQVGVFDYDKLNDTNKEWIKTHDWCATVIEDFDGNIEFVVDTNNNLHVVGTGNKDFFTVQSEF